MKWNYPILYTDFSDESFSEMVLEIRKQALLNQIPFPSTDYVGTDSPSITFVGDSLQGFGFDHRPFHSFEMSRFFEGNKHDPRTFPQNQPSVWNTNIR